MLSQVNCAMPHILCFFLRKINLFGWSWASCACWTQIHPSRTAIFWSLSRMARNANFSTPGLKYDITISQFLWKGKNFQIMELLGLISGIFGLRVCRTNIYIPTSDIKSRSRSQRSEMCKTCPISKAISSTNVHVINRQMVNYDISRQ